MNKSNIIQNLFQNGRKQNGSSEKGLKRIPPPLTGDNYVRIVLLGALYTPALED
jgi:hypothetical protein